MIQNLFGLILEGVSGTGKTTLLKALSQSDRYREKSYLSSLILSEHQTQRILEKKQREIGLVKSDNLSLLESHLKYLEELEGRLEQMEWCRKEQIQHRVPFLLERFHLTHVVEYEHIIWADVEEVDSRLLHLNGKLCVLTGTSEQLKERLFNVRDDNWNNYIKRFGSTQKEILYHFLRRQEQLLELSERSTLPRLILNPSESSLKDSVDAILSFWGIP